MFSSISSKCSKNSIIELLKPGSEFLMFVEGKLSLSHKRNGWSILSCFKLSGK